MSHAKYEVHCNLLAAGTKALVASVVELSCLGMYHIIDLSWGSKVITLISLKYLIIKLSSCLDLEFLPRTGQICKTA